MKKSLKNLKAHIVAIGMSLLFPILLNAQTVSVFYNSSIEQIKFAANDVKLALESKNFSVEMLPLSALTADNNNRKIVITFASDNSSDAIFKTQGGTTVSGLGEQAYALRTTTSPEKSFWVFGGDANGAMYGALEISESIVAHGMTETYNKQESPFMLNRGMKLNMPLDRRIPTYVGGWSSTSTGKAIPHVWDISFWKKLIDQQARYRYNVLSVWVHHPFPALVKLADYPNASLPNIEGFNGYVKNLNHQQRVAFWREVMQYAHSRGMKFYFFNWNVYLDYAKDKYPALTTSATNATTKDYMYKSMYALIDTYPELDGFGISAGDGMMSQPGFNNNSEIKTQWTWDTMGKAVRDYLAANPTRSFNLIHRGIGSSPDIWDQKFSPLKTLPNATSNYSVKYAQAHMYSTPTPAWTTSSINTIKSLNTQTWLTVRNDDYFYINWGDPKFVRDYMAGVPHKDVVTGMYIGSDGYTPSRTYFYKNPALNGQLEVERRWYMEMLWGRISYNPEVSDEVFKNMLAKRFPTVSSNDLFQAWTLASRPLPRATEMIMRNWALDFDWYPEGCNSDPGRCTGFRTVQDFANMSTHPNAKTTTVANGSDLCDIPTSAAGNCGNKKSSYTVADEMQADAQTALNIAENLISGGNLDLQMAINNIKQMGYLSLYYAHKIRGATFLRSNQVGKARDEMARAYCVWMKYTRSMEDDYYGDSFRNMDIKPNWSYADADVLRDYTSLGGIGSPICGDVSYVVSVSANDDSKGTVLGGGPYNPNDLIEIKAVPKTGFRFTKWTENGAYISSDIHLKFVVDKDRNLVAHFIENNVCAFPWTDAGITVNKATVEKTYGPIDIRCAVGDVSISIDVEGVGTDNSDYCRIFYRVNGGAQQAISQDNGAFARKTVTVKGIKGNSLEIIISSKNSWNDEFYYINNIKVLDSSITSTNLTQSSNFKLYPNPVSDKVNIVFPDNKRKEINIYNAMGALVKTTTVYSNEYSFDVVNLLQKGIFLMQVHCENTIANHKFVVN